VVTYFHVELSRHAVLLAEGLPCESYLDTGNRAAFANGGAAVAMHPDFARRVWRRQGCADLVVKGRALARVRRRLLARAVVMGHATTGDAALHLLVDGQVRLPAIVGRVYRFPLPGIESRIRLVSRSTVPAYVRAGAVDHRPLGVAVSQIRLDGRTIPLGDARLCSGWHAVEGGKAGAAWRWTDGNAGLALSGVHVLEVEVLITEQYWVKRNDEARIAVAGHPRRAAVSFRSCVVAG
jgi:hypothetical protein